MKKLVLGIAAGIAALVPAGAASPMTTAACTYEAGPVCLTPQGSIGYCIVNVGYCEPQSGCYVNVGYCETGGNCTVNAGHCRSGDNSLVRL